jgi:prepilin-type processing-associated H-X9-DG protein
VDDFGSYPRYCTGTLLFTTPGKFWMQSLETYVGDKWPDDTVVLGSDGNVRDRLGTTSGNRVFACPGYNRVRGVYYHAGHPKGMFGGTGAYAYNAIDGVAPYPFGFGGVPLDEPFQGLSQLRPIRESEVINPSRMIAIGDSTIVPQGPEDPDQMGIPMAPWSWYLAPDQLLTPQDKAMLRRHGGRWNQVFCDGHVENGRLEDYFDYRKDEVLKLWNRDNEPHRTH